jgi:hypothetical protein
MDRATIIRRLIERTAADFVSYFVDTPHEGGAARVIAAAIAGPPTLFADREIVEALLPDTEEDGRWEASYALNTGAMVLSLIDYVQTNDEQHYRDAVTLFFDTVDFKVHQQLEQGGIDTPRPEQIATHPLLTQERRWFESLESAAQGGLRRAAAKQRIRQP